MNHYTVDGFFVGLDGELEDRTNRLFAMLENIKTDATSSLMQLDELEGITSKIAATSIKKLRNNLIETVSSMAGLKMALIVKSDMPQ